MGLNAESEEVIMNVSPVIFVAGAALLAAGPLAAQPASAPEAMQHEHAMKGGMKKLTDKQKIAKAMSAGPKEIAANASIVDMSDMEKPATLRKGTNGWACIYMPTETMCLDPVWQKWAAAWMSKGAFSTTETGVGYMLNGDNGASNTDPWAEKPTADNHWVVAPAHVMLLLPDAKMLDAYPTDWTGGGPWVMWKGTPYAHVMLPVSQTHGAK
jgi:hypothetical protein